MATKIKRNDNAAARWHSTGFMSGGVSSVDVGKHSLLGASVIRPGEANGHGMWIDAELCAKVALLGNSGKSANGLKARFGHPNMCNEALGTFLGRWKNFSVNADGGVVADLFLSSTAEESPKGNLRKYIEELAAKEPNHFGASIVFTRDQNAECEFLLANGATSDGEYISLDGFKSPDALNVNNLPHARAAELHAADLVDDPAATDGMFAGAAGLSLAAQMTEWLDTHPEVFTAITADGAMVELLTRYGKELGPFIERYQANKPKLEAEQSPAADAATEAPPATPAEPEVKPTEETPAVESQATAAVDELQRLRGELAAASTRAESAEKTIAALTPERDELAQKLKLADADKSALEGQRNEAQKRLEAIEVGQLPVSSSPAKAELKRAGSMWDDARASAKHSRK